MKKISIITALLGTCSLLPAQNVLNKTVESFNKISAFGGVDITIVDGDNNTVKLESNDINLDEVILKVEDSKLIINTTSKILDKYRHVSARISVKNLNYIKLNARSELTSQLEFTSDTLEIIAGNGSTVNLKVKTQLIVAEAGQGSTISLEGTSSNMDAEAGSGGIINAYDLQCENAVVKTNTGGLAKVNVKQSLNAAVSLGGNISYRGNPTKLKTHSALGGKIEPVVE